MKNFMPNTTTSISKKGLRYAITQQKKFIEEQNNKITELELLQEHMHEHVAVNETVLDRLEAKYEHLKTRHENLKRDHARLEQDYIRRLVQLVEILS